MTKNFPLYDDLLEKVKSEQMLSADIRRICSTITTLHKQLKPEIVQTHYEIIHALCLHHEILETKGLVHRMNPYGCKTFEGGKGILYITANLPPMLQQIIAQYVINFITNDKN